MMRALASLTPCDDPERARRRFGERCLDVILSPDLSMMRGIAMGEEPHSSMGRLVRLLDGEMARLELGAFLARRRRCALARWR
ncbi:hypothetical protein [Chromobacterium violaceum]|uniref:hypothetical protein n=1 Tax=Chromobacterium violaceum TaxID=536 RepID=UPI00143D58B7|nr:hypothetical protein [Chromobacterium violaceum]QIY79821.1 hypothetical protein FOB43_11740 [Chromobacterium violaceum]